MNQVSKSQRRGLIVVCYISLFLLLVVVTFLKPVLPFWVFGACVAAGLSGLLFACYKLFYQTGLWRLGHSPDLDERQLQVRNHAYLRAYAFVAFTGFGFLFYGALAIDFKLWLPQTFDQANWFVFGYLFLTATLPAFLAAWDEREI